MRTLLSLIFSFMICGGLGKWATSLSVSSGIFVYIYMWVIFKLLSGWYELYWSVCYENVISFWIKQAIWKKNANFIQNSDTGQMSMAMAIWLQFMSAKNTSEMTQNDF
jgi:hypothetical protein